MENARFIQRPKGRSFRAFFIRIAFEEAWFDHDNHFQAARQETCGKIDLRPSNKDFAPIMTGAEDGDGD